MRESMQRLTNSAYSYEIDNGDANWEDAEQQIQSSMRTQRNGTGRSTVVSVKSSKPTHTDKRKINEKADVVDSDTTQVKKRKKERKVGK